MIQEAEPLVMRTLLVWSSGRDLKGLSFSELSWSILCEAEVSWASVVWGGSVFSPLNCLPRSFINKNHACHV